MGARAPLHRRGGGAGVPAGKRGGATDGHADYLLGAPRWLLRGAFQAPRPQNNARSAPGSKIHHLPPPGSHFETDSKLSQYQYLVGTEPQIRIIKTVTYTGAPVVPNKVTNVITKRSFCHPNNLLGFREYQSKRLDKREGEDVDPIQWTSPAVLLT